LKYVPYLIEAAAIIAAALLLAPKFTRTSTTNERATLRATILPPEKAQFSSIETDEGGVPAVSPDGRYVVSPVHEADGKVRLWLRPLQSTEGRILPGTEGAGHVFWSPDSHSIAFFAHGKVKRTDIEGSAVYNITDCQLGRGGTWGADGTILFAPGLSTSLSKVPATGGTAVEVTKRDSEGYVSHRWPQFLPDGRHFLFVQRSQKTQDTGLYLASLDDPTPHLVIPTVYNGSYVAPGYILFVRDGGLFAQKFDASSLKLSGEPVPLPDRVGLFSPANNALFSASNTGVLAYYPLQVNNSYAQLVWYERSGKKSEALLHMFLGASALSPDGSTIAISAYSPNEWIPKLWKYDLQRGTTIPLTQSWGASPVWSGDGQSLYFGRVVGKSSQIHKVSSSGGSDETVYTPEEGFAAFPLSLCRDGKTLLFGRTSIADTQQTTVWAMRLDSPEKPIQLLSADQRAGVASLSPDCNWIAYETRVTGEREIAITHFPDGAHKYQVSTAGGFNPIWRHDGKELFFYSPSDSSISSVSVESHGQELSLGKATALFQVHPFAPRIGVFDVTPDGQRFLVFGDTSSFTGTPLFIVQNWDANLIR
jgi:Tol biopolymer transport system component